MDLTTYTDTELMELQFALTAERKRREASPLVDQGQAEVVEGLRESGVIEAPAVPEAPTDPSDFDAWVDPGTDHSKMYLLGDYVSHGERVWESTHPGLNHWEPGTEGVDWRMWRDVTDVVFPPEVDPETPEGPDEWDGQGVEYAVGDLVTFDGVVYRVLQAHTSQPGWTPDAVPAMFEVVEDEEPEP